MRNKQRKMTNGTACWLPFALTLLVFCASATRAQNASNVGVVITNQARATYSDPGGTDHQTTSNPVSLTVLAVVNLNVTPDDTQPTGVMVPNEQVTRVFRICNTGNVADQYSLAQATITPPATISALYWDTDGSGTLTPVDTKVTLNATLTPVLQPGECLGILVIVDTGAIKLDEVITITLTGKSNTDKNKTDNGTNINKGGEGTKVTDPKNPALPPVKYVENKDQITSTAGAVLNYSINFRNSGATPAINVLLSDDLPPELDYVPGTMKMGSLALTDAIDDDIAQVINSRRLEVKLAKVEVNQVISVTFQARLNNNTKPGVGVINTAQVAGDNIGTAIRTAKTVVVINPEGTVYAGYSNGGVLIPGASVLVSTDVEGKSPLPMPTGGFSPNDKNENPFLTDGKGHFAFAFAPDQVGTPGAPVTYYIHVTAQGYRQRLIEIKMEPTAAGLFKIAVSSLDGQPIAQAGSFALTSSGVTLNDISALVMNIPMFETATLQLAKVADKQRAEIGETISYRLEAHNATATKFTNVSLVDTLPQSFLYVPGTARVQVEGATLSVEPTIKNNQFTFVVGNLPAGARATITYRVRIGANAKQGEQINLAFAQGEYPNGDPLRTPPVKAPVLVGLGAFSMRQLILGRVFEDTNGNGLFEACDRPVAGARVYLNNGMSVITDSHGLYNFPSVEEGAAVVSLDPITVPRGYALQDEGRKAARSWTRLVRTPLGGGGLNRVNFALEKIVNPLTETVTDIGAVETSVEASAGANIATPNTLATTWAAPNKAAEPNERKAETGLAGAFDHIINKRTEPKTRAGVAAMNVGRNGHKAAGTYTEKATETIEPVAPGKLVVLSPEANEVILEASLRVEARVFMDYTVALELNGQRIPDANVGVKEIDRKNQVATFVFVGINLKPGPNQLKVLAVAPDGSLGEAATLTVMGRGPATRLEIVTDKKEIQSGGRDATRVHVRAYDAWGNPALGGQVGLQISAGRLLRTPGQPVATTAAPPTKETATEKLPAASTATTKAPVCGRTADAKTKEKGAKNECVAALAAARNITYEEAEKLRSPLIGAGAEPVNGFAAEQVSAAYRQQILSLENGEAVIDLIGEGQPGNAELRAFSGDLQAKGVLRITPEQRPQILVGLAEASFGKAAPDIVQSGSDKNYRHHMEFFYRGPLPQALQLTLAYNSFRPLTRTAGRDRAFFLDPLDRVYPLFGDSSTRFEEAQSNSKLYARLDRGRSYAMFGDFDASQQEYLNDSYTSTPVTNLAENLASAGIGNTVLNNFNSIPVFAGQGPQLTGYNRRLTGVKVHLENAGGSSVTLSGARPDTAFARDVFPGSTFGLLQLSHTDILQGTETIVREVRDRRNPDLILQREVLVRSVDYNLDSYVGSLFFMRPLSTFDYALNLIQIVATYEYRSVGMNSAVYTARGSQNFQRAGLRIGTSFIDQRQESYGSFYLGGVDVEKKIGKSGSLQLEWGMSQGSVASSGSTFGFDGLAGSWNSGNGEHNGHAYRAEYRQPLGFGEAQIQASFARADQAFFNPFGATITPGSQRGSVAFDMKPIRSGQMRIGFTDERNRTANFRNSRRTGSIGWIQSFGDKLRFSLGYDYRHFTDEAGSALATNANANADAKGTAGNGAPATASQFAGREVTSNLITAGAEYHPNDKISVAVKREQNLGAADPTYPDQTTVAASYQVSALAKIFFTERLASQAITAISDVSASGFAQAASRRETALGIESPLSKYTTMSGRYQINNGINGTDSFAVIGLMNRFPINKLLSLDAGYERGMHLKGNGHSFNNAMIGFSYNPTNSFRSAARYELRDLYGFGNIITIGVAGKLSDSWTSLGRMQYSRTAFQNQATNVLMNGQLALSWRPLESDKTALLFSYNFRSLEQGARQGFAPLVDHDTVISMDGLYQPLRRVELYGRYALKFNRTGRDGLPVVGTFTSLIQGRAEWRFIQYFDWAGEIRTLWLSGTGSRRTSIGTELGFWALSDVRLAGGYNFTRMKESPGYFGSFGAGSTLNTRHGFYFVVSSKLSNMFNLFGTSPEGLVGHEPTPAPASAPKQEE
ncbi:MAG: isopeptide-forming domain-containing fimbrial protein [Blastocatellia bacterium]